MDVREGEGASEPYHKSVGRGDGVAFDEKGAQGDIGRKGAQGVHRGDVIEGHIQRLQLSQMPNVSNRAQLRKSLKPDEKIKNCKPIQSLKAGWEDIYELRRTLYLIMGDRQLPQFEACVQSFNVPNFVEINVQRDEFSQHVQATKIDKFVVRQIELLDVR
jgi:hypothetical protein